jgi:hypothetical protein
VGGRRSNGPPPIRRGRVGEVERGGLHAISALGVLDDGAGGLRLPEAALALARMMRGNVGEREGAEPEGKEPDS